MKKTLHLSILFFSIQLFSQKDSVNAYQIKVLNTNYKDFLTINKQIYAITKGDSLVVFDFEKGNIEKTIPNTFSIAKTSKNEIYYVNQKGQILLTKDFIKTKKINKVRGKHSKILVDKNDNSIVITTDGIFYKNNIYTPEKKCVIYRPNYSDYDQENYFFTIPTLTYLDKEEHLWLTYDNGEFGDDVWIFDLKTRKFYEDDYLYLKKNFDASFYKTKEYKKQMTDSFPDKIKMLNNELVYKFPNNLPISKGVKGISENNKEEILISQSTMHFFISGRIAMLTKTNIPNFYKSFSLNEILEYDEVDGNELNNLSFIKEYIGPNNFNVFDNSFYYYSDKGFFKIIRNNNKYTKEFIFRPWITWTSGMSHSLGYQMNVIKFEFISEKEILFLTSNEGIGYYDGKIIKYFK